MRPSSRGPTLPTLRQDGCVRDLHVAHEAVRIHNVGRAVAHHLVRDMDALSGLRVLGLWDAQSGRYSRATLSLRSTTGRSSGGGLPLPGPG